MWSSCTLFVHGRLRQRAITDGACRVPRSAATIAGVKTQYDVVVIGAGVIGTMTAKALAERGQQTLILERFQLGHKGGSSHGLSRIVRVTDYHPDYVRINRLAMRAWEELQDAAGETLLVRTGNLEIGEGAQIYADALDAAGERFAWLDPGEASERWPALRLRADERMFVQEDGGVCLADRTVRAAARLAVEAGAELREGTRVERVRDHDTFAEVVVEGETIRSSVVVVTAGAWARNLLADAGVDLPLVPTLEQVSYYKLEAPSPLPTIIDYTVDEAIDHYAVPHPTEVGSFKTRVGSRGPGRRSGHTFVRSRRRALGARGGLGPQSIRLLDSHGSARDLSLHEHAGQRLRPGSHRVDRHRLGVQRARVQGEPGGRHDLGGPRDGRRLNGPARPIPRLPARAPTSASSERAGPGVGPTRSTAYRLTSLSDSFEPSSGRPAGAREVGEMVGFCRSPGERARW